MKKIFLCLGTVLLLCGCSNEKDLYEHYNLKDKDLNKYTYINDYGRKEVYALVDITPHSYESILTGLFYKVGEDDYILLGKLESSSKSAYKKKSMYQFYEDKLYGVGNGDTPMAFVFDLKGKDSSIKELNFKYNDQIVGTTSITNSIEDNYINFYGIVYIDEHNTSKYFRCSLKDYQCELTE